MTSCIFAPTKNAARVDYVCLYRQLNNLGKLEPMDVFNRRLKTYRAMSSALAHATGYTVVHVP
jgi:hypothetical protein